MISLGRRPAVPDLVLVSVLRLAHLTELHDVVQGMVREKRPGKKGASPPEKTERSTVGSIAAATVNDAIWGKTLAGGMVSP